MESVQTLEPGGFTLADLDTLPDDGMRYELVDGQLLVTPAPLAIHQRVAGQLFLRLQPACPEELEVFFAPFDFRPNKQRSLQPDLLVCRSDDIGPRGVEFCPLLLAVEILSPSTRMTDLLLKRALYEEAGVTSYWLFDPEAEELTVLELVDGAYVERAVAKGNEIFQAALPFAVPVVPSELVRPVNAG
ncbi:Uma2 family endonuclease [Kribbella sp. NPDC051770]|uniref:Uma2 family endonuclease n=1 Tax=Kribbella sp. NPDC051770 TaxID=3155413 RepID=UPI003443D771